MTNTQKATGWKIPIIFCAIILSLGCIGYILVPKERNMPPLPQALLDKAGATIIDLDNPGSRPWQDAIVDAASGFAPREVKDAKLAGIIKNALAEGRLDVACAAIVQIRDAKMRDALLDNILANALQDCSQMHWGVFAVASMADNDLATSQAQMLTQHWNECNRKNKRQKQLGFKTE